MSHIQYIIKISRNKLTVLLYCNS